MSEPLYFSDATLLHDLQCNHDAMGRDESIYSRAIADIKALRELIDSKLHVRRCHDCRTAFWAADAVTPYCLCPNCKSQDTRRVKSPWAAGGEWCSA